MMIFDAFLLGAQIGLLYAPLALGIFLALNVLSLPDLTLEGSFGLGGAAAATGLLAGADPVTSIGLGIAAGACAGLVTALAHVFLHMNVLLTGILMTTACWSITIAIMGTGNVSLVHSTTLFTWAQEGLGLRNQGSTILVAGAATALFAGLLVWFLGTGYGLAMRATGLNIQTARGLGIRTEKHQIVGLMIANGLAGASGGLVVQSQGFMDVSIQGGVIVVGLAALMIGTTLLRSDRIDLGLLSVVAGVVVYRWVVAVCLRLGVPPNNLRLITALIVVGFIAARLHGTGLSLLTDRRQRARRHVQFLENDRVTSLF